MVSAISSSPYFSYLSQLQGAQSATAAADASAPETTETDAATDTATASQDSTASSLAASLLSGGSFSPEVFSLLQQSGTGSFDPISTLLGGSGTSDGLTSVFANLFASSVSSSLTQAKTNGVQQAQTATEATGTSAVENLLNGISQASVAYNQTNLQNAQNVTAANSYQANGVTALVA